MAHGPSLWGVGWRHHAGRRFSCLNHLSMEVLQQCDIHVYNGFYVVCCTFCCRHWRFIVMITGLRKEVHQLLFLGNTWSVTYWNTKQLSYPSLSCQCCMETFFDGRISGSCCRFIGCELRCNAQAKVFLDIQKAIELCLVSSSMVLHDRVFSCCIRLQKRLLLSSVLSSINWSLYSSSS